MKYSNGSAFRRALEDRLRNINIRNGIPLTRLRKIIAFDRFMARLLKYDPAKWVLKGGLALELRLGPYARTTRDMDLLAFYKAKEIHGLLVKSGKIDLGDFFSFQVNKPSSDAIETIGGVRFPVLSLLDGRLFEQFHIDVGVSDQLLGSPDYLNMPSWLDFANIKSTFVPCYSIAQQIAEKFHALTRPYAGGDTSRVKDLIDILLLAGIAPIASTKLRKAIISTFENRNTHPLPDRILKMSTLYAKSYSNLAKQIGLKFTKIDEGNIAVGEFLLPIITSNSRRTWNPKKWQWE